MNKISLIAASYVGQKEISGNKGFVNKDFNAKMEGVGFYVGAPWCGFFTQLVWKEAGQDIKLLSSSSKSVIDKAAKGGNWHAKPVAGAVVVWAMFKNGRRQWQGHLGVVTEVSENGVDYSTIEGNTTDKGGREGIMVAVRNRQLTPDKWKTENGLRLMGFVYPENI
jgi:hypothetical protein